MDNEKAAQVMLYGGSGSAVYFAWGDFVGMIGGLLIGLAGLGIAWYYQRQRNKREQERHEYEMGRIAGEKELS